MNVDRT